MKILLSSHFFAPSIGGIEEVSELLAAEFARAGHAVTIVTQSTGTGNGDMPCEVVRRPSPSRLVALVKWCDVFFHNNISLQTAWPLVFLRKPWVVAHHTWICRPGEQKRLRDRLKLRVIRSARNIAISGAIAEHLGVPSVPIGDPYRDDLFKRLPEIARDRDVVFLGRLVSDKGVDLLLEAMGILKGQGVNVTAGVVGDGPELARLREMAGRLGISDRVDFTGSLRGNELVRLLNRHRVLAVPSRWPEPFGIVALEGLACGCRVVGSTGGGLAEAIGVCGILFPSGDAAALAQGLKEALSSPVDNAAAAKHLARHRAAAVARAYLDVLQEAVG